MEQLVVFNQLVETKVSDVPVFKPHYHQRHHVSAVLMEVTNVVLKTELVV
jgi:hypothetical protein